MLPGYVPRPGDVFTILQRTVNATEIAGQFSRVEVEGAPPGLTFAVEVNGITAVQIRVVSTVTLEALAQETSEDGVPVVFVVRSSVAAPAGGFLSVPVELAGTARRFDDFVTDFTGTTVRIPAGESEARIAVLPLRDAVAEGDETITLRLAPGGTAAPGTPAEATATLHDGPPTTTLSVAGIAPAPTSASSRRRSTGRPSARAPRCASSAPARRSWGTT